MRFVAYRADGETSFVLSSLSFAWRWLCILEDAGIERLVEIDRFGRQHRVWS